jgi:hypothetical protein
MPLKFDSSKIIKKLANKDKLVPYIDKVWETFDRPLLFSYEPKKSDLGWHPSSHCTPSPLELYDEAQLKMIDAVITEEFYMPLPEVNKLSASTRKAFLVGHFWHQILQHIICQELHWCKQEDIERHSVYDWSPVQPYNGLNGLPRRKPFHYVSGSGDIAPCVAPDWTGLVDIKTMGSRAFKLSSLPTDTYGDSYSTAEKYECQINIYMELFDLDSAIILAVNKDSPHDLKEYMFNRNQDLMDTIFEKWKFVSKCLEIGKPPTEADDLLFPIITKGPLLT